MNLDVNLARDPFRNDTIFYALAGILGLAGLFFLSIETRAIYGAFQTRRMLVADIRDANARIQSDRDDDRRLAAYLDRASLKEGLVEATTLTRLLRLRTFDWNRLFEELEAVLPGAVMLTSIQPSIGEDKSAITLGGAAKTLADLNELVQRLEKSDRFSEVFVLSQTSEDGEIKFSVTARYAPEPVTHGGAS